MVRSGYCQGVNAKRADRLTAEDWTIAMLEMIAEHGVRAASIEGLAKRLGVTKGSAYWHFADRDALLQAATSHWEVAATASVIDTTAQVSDPIERLAALFAVSFGDAERGPVDTALAVMSDDPVIGPTVRRVTGLRLQYLASIFVELGCSNAVATRRARLAYAAYLGHFSLERSLPADNPLVGDSCDYVDEAVAVFARN